MLLVTADRVRLFQSTPPARAATHACTAESLAALVSIHAAREGGDPRGRSRARPPTCFNPRRPRGRRLFALFPDEETARFNPRRPRGRRPQLLPRRPSCSGFNPRRPRGRRPFGVIAKAVALAFQSTPPARAATAVAGFLAAGMAVSIHAAREGGDARTCSTATRGRCFNPRRPRGRRRWSGWDSRPTRCFNPRRPRGRRLMRRLPCPSIQSFQSTPPARAATGTRKQQAEYGSVSIHAAREGGD